jgi:hypothetical protein
LSNNKRGNYSQKKILWVGIFSSWIILATLFFTGILEVSVKGHIENSLLVSFALVLFAGHLASILKNFFHKYS